MAFPSSSIRVIEDGGSRLTIVCPPYYLAAAMALGIPLVAFVGFFVGLVATGFDWSVVAFVVAIQAPLLLFGFGLTMSHATAVFDRTSGEVEIRERLLGLATRRRVLPLASIKLAFVSRGRGTGRLALLLKDTSAVPIGWMTTQAGRREAEQAVNAFLSRGRT